MEQPGKVANPARGQLNRENSIPMSPCVPENLVSRDGFSRPVPRQPAHLHTQAESDRCCWVRCRANFNVNDELYRQNYRTMRSGVLSLPGTALTSPWPTRPG